MSGNVPKPKNFLEIVPKIVQMIDLCSDNEDDTTETDTPPAENIEVKPEIFPNYSSMTEREDDADTEYDSSDEVIYCDSIMDNHRLSPIAVNIKAELMEEAVENHSSSILGNAATPFSMATPHNSTNFLITSVQSVPQTPQQAKESLESIMASKPFIDFCQCILGVVMSFQHLYEFKQKFGFKAEHSRTANLIFLFEYNAFYFTKKHMYLSLMAEHMKNYYYKLADYSRSEVMEQTMKTLEIVANDSNLQWSTISHYLTDDRFLENIFDNWEELVKTDEVSENNIFFKWNKEEMRLERQKRLNGGRTSIHVPQTPNNLTPAMQIANGFMSPSEICPTPPQDLPYTNIMNMSQRPNYGPNTVNQTPGTQNYNQTTNTFGQNRQTYEQNYVQNAHNLQNIPNYDPNTQNYGYSQITSNHVSGVQNISNQYYNPSNNNLPPVQMQQVNLGTQNSYMTPNTSVQYNSPPGNYPQSLYNVGNIQPEMSQLANVAQNQQQTPSTSTSQDFTIAQTGPTNFVISSQRHKRKPKQRIYARKPTKAKLKKLSNYGFTNTALLKCTVCNISSSMVCKSCQRVAYCNFPCQEIDARSHSQVCSPFDFTVFQ